LFISEQTASKKLIIIEALVMLWYRHSLLGLLPDSGKERPNGNSRTRIQCSDQGSRVSFYMGPWAFTQYEDILNWFQWDSFPKDVKLVRYDARGHGESQLILRLFGKLTLPMAASIVADQFDILGKAVPLEPIKNIFKGAANTDLPPREEFKAIKDIPCQILAWVGDPTHPVSSAGELHKLLPKSELFIAQGYNDFKTIPQRMQDFVVKHA
jgi:hypothetical protein